MSLQFYREWFGIHGGREVFLKDRRTRIFIEKAEDLASYVEECRKRGLPAYCSVQPYRERDQPLGLEKLYFDFDCKEDLKEAWKEDG